ncbi:hypothetical protein [Phytohabitans houttuyneae]|uniref:Uncharacterized protein n=1 Tax=Phytohabitans houttuyneae TaxID=1076126 RepID=A0A6V8KFN7_9ACTN|nr:hypothetical protein [Phytohabitans houttuyneae]GFJ79545.1 hypothetical protein Phou_037250 [Phytohabitans houttuyneae]
MTAPNRAELAQDALFWSAVADAAKEKAQRARAALDSQARAELERDGVAPTWRIPGVGTVPLSLTSDSVDVTDPDAYLAWVAKRHPTEVETTVHVRPAFDKAVREAAAKRGAPCDEQGEVIPGLTYRSGGAPRGVSIRPSTDARAAAARAAERFLAQAAQAESEVAA